MDETPTTSRWRRVRRRRRDDLRRLLAIGAVVGLAVGALAQLFVGGVDGELGWLVRTALMLPAFVFLGWWLLVPGIRLEDPSDASTPVPADPGALDRVARIETVFDTAAVPRARREQLDQPESALRATYRGSVRRGSARQGEQLDAWGVRRSAASTGDGSTGS